MQPAAKKCLWWAGASIVGAVVLQVVAPWGLTALWTVTDSYSSDGWYIVVSLLSGIANALLFPLAAVLVGAAVVINVLVPRVGATREDDAADPQQHHAEDVPVSDRRDAVGIADASVYEPPRS
ncbi:hypothetical protein [Demequina sp. NBRC 110051]|uniref:hypothetical protein n=1 Tax=Demequina sp. NBRC 110051 TaxID=1570340 RepID=UPI000A00B21F|nr:hypothetical protein [Demequina sp. NBRC 110051]